MDDLDRLVVVCGARGFLGRNFISGLLARGHTNILGTVRSITQLPPNKIPGVHWAYGDLQDPYFCQDILTGAYAVYNFAANVGGIGYITGQESACFQSARINLNLLEACEKNNVSDYFFASSSCVYPNHPYPVTESGPIDPLPGYGEEKYFSERACIAYTASGRVRCTVARIHGLYGPGENRPAGREHVIESTVKKMIVAKLSGDRRINIWGDGTQTRNFLYIDDAVDGIYRLVDSRAGFGPFNLAHRDIHTVNDVVDAVEEAAGINVERVYTRSPIGCQNKVANISRLVNSLHWEPTVNLHAGVLATWLHDYGVVVQDDIWQTSSPQTK